MKRLTILSLAALLPAGTTWAQQAPADRLLDTVTVTTHKFEEKSRHLAQPVQVMDAAAIQNAAASNTAGLLEASGAVTVQRSQLGGGSPVIRGFEASRILLMVDGIRLNNAIYRTGHLQNILTVDHQSLERVEILFGPASTIYGSDALGGVVSMYTPQPQLSGDASPRLKAQASARYASPAGEAAGHIGFHAGGRRLASFTSLSYNRLGDLRQGSRRSSAYPDFGKRPFYIARLQGADTVRTNPDPERQVYSGYRQADLVQKLLWKPGVNATHLLNFQYSASSDIPRYDRLTDTRNGLLRWAEWYYGPQRRLLAAYQYRATALPGFFEEMMGSIHYQAIEESRIQRAYQKTIREHRVEHLQVAGFSLDFRRLRRRSEWTAGLDGQLNFLRSEAFGENVETAQREGGIDTRYPDGGSHMHYAGVYVQHLYKIVPGKWILNEGLRLGYNTLGARFSDTSLLHLPFTEARQQHATWSANAGLVYLPDSRSKYSLSVSTGYRSPNIDDLSKVSESAAGSAVVVPNPGLRPEQTCNFDLGLSRAFGPVSVTLNGYYTLFRNGLVSDRFTFNGSDSIYYNGALTAVTALQNKARARLYGMQADLSLRPVPGGLLYARLAYTRGRYTNPDGSTVPLDHIAPLAGTAGLRYTGRGFSAEGYVRYNGWKKKADYNPYGEDNLQYATSDGMPSWYTLNMSAWWQAGPSLRLMAAVENLLDRNYRVFASGISAPGRNFVLQLSASL